jgi:CheY-like chemotaxis protein
MYNLKRIYLNKIIPCDKIDYINKKILNNDDIINSIKINKKTLSNDENDKNWNTYITIKNIFYKKEVIKKEDNIMEYIKCLFHDFRSPLNNISMGIAILENINNNDEEVYNIINNIKHSCYFINNSLNGFLNLNNIMNNNDEFINIKNEQFSILHLIKTTINLLFFKIKEKKINIIYSFSDDIIDLVYGDFCNLQHVFLNLLSNAIKFSKNNSNINFNVINKNNDYIFNIIDENVYIEEHIKNKLFLKYNTDNNKNAINNTPGTGLGLFICKKIIDLLNGEIYHSYNDKHEGNIFTVKLKLNKYNNIIELPMTPENTPITTPINRTINKYYINIYIVDDDNISRKMLKKILSLKLNNNINIVEFEDGLDLINKCHDILDTINIIFIDNKMKHLNGILTTKILRALGYKNIIIGLSGDNNENFYKYGADKLYLKPLSNEHIDEIINDLFNN